MTLLIAYALLAVGVSFLCSLLEASLLSLPRSHIEMLVDKGASTGRLLQSFKQNIDRPLTAILTLNTIANTAGAVGVGAQAAAVFGSGAVGVTCALLTLLILVVSEIIPKTLGAVYTKPMAAVTARLTWFMIVLCAPVVASLKWVELLVGRRRHEEMMSRAELAAAIRLGQEAGSLERGEFRVISNLLALSKIRISTVLTPRTVLFALPEEMTIEQVIAQHQPVRFARIPIYRESLDDVTGYVARFDIYRASSAGGKDKRLKEVAKPILVLPAVASVANALELMLKNQQHISLIVDEHGGTAGIATLEDALETLLGQEIVDETDLVADMQEMARSRRTTERPRDRSR